MSYHKTDLFYVFRKVLLFCLAATFISLLIACNDDGGDGDNATDNATDNSTTTSTIEDGEASALYYRIEEIIQDVSDKLKKDIQMLSPEDAFQAAADFMESQPEVEVAECDVANGINIYARFTNGITFVMPAVNADSDGEDLADTKVFQNNAVITADHYAGVKKHFLTAMGSSTNRGLPTDKSAVFLDMQNLGSAAADFQTMAKYHGYEPVEAPAPGYQVDFFKRLSYHPLVYVSSHGVLMGPFGGRHYYVLLTDDPRTQDQDDVYLANGDFENYRVTLSKGVRYIRTETLIGADYVFDFSDNITYAVTSELIDHYCSGFDPFSFIFFDTCHSMNDVHKSTQLLIAPMAKVFMENKEVGTYMGWDNAVHQLGSDRASKYLFTRLFGEHSYYDGPADDPYRPFTVPDVCEALKKNSYYFDVFGDYGAELKWLMQDYGGAGQCIVLLLPSIDQLSPDVDKKQLAIKGNFGDLEGEVEIEGGSVTIVTWESESIIVDCEPENCFGPVQVIYDGRESNIVPLTRWQGSLKITNGMAGTNNRFNFDLDIDFQFRADIHPWRRFPDDSVFYSEQKPPLDSGYGKCKYELSGGYSDARYKYEYTTELNTGEAPIFDKSSTTGAPYTTGTISLDPEAGKATFGINIILKVMITKTDLETNQVESVDESREAIILFIEDVEMDKYGTIEAGSDSVSYGGFTFDVQWEEMVPDYPPDENTPS